MKLAVGTSRRNSRTVRRFLADRAPLTRVRELMETPDGIDREVWGRRAPSSACRASPSPRSTAAPGFSFAEQAIILEEFGAALYGGPYLASAVLAATALLAGRMRRRGASCCRDRLRREGGDAGRHRGRRIVGSGGGAAHPARTPRRWRWTGTRASCWTGRPRT